MCFANRFIHEEVRVKIHNTLQELYEIDLDFEEDKFWLLIESLHSTLDEKLLIKKGKINE